MTNDRKCGDCLFLVEDEGKPFYCAILDLYTVREKDDTGCEKLKIRKLMPPLREIRKLIFCGCPILQDIEREVEDENK